MTSQLNIRVGEDWLDMPTNATLKYTITSNIFFDGEKQRERSLPLQMPNTPTNNRVLGWLVEHGTENSANTMFNCSLHSNLTFVADGTLKVRETQNGYSIFILGQWATLSDTFRDDRLRDITWPTGLTAPVTKQDIAEGSYPDYPVWYPAMLMFKAAPQDNWIDANEGVFASYTGRYLAGTGPNSNTQAANAAFYLLYILDTLCDAYNIGRITGLFRDDAELSQLLCHSIDIRNFDWEKSNFTPESIPDMSIMEFLAALETVFCCEFVLDADRNLSNRWLRDTAIRTDYADWTNKLSGPILRKWEEAPTDIKLSWPKSLTDLYPPIEIEAAAETIKVAINLDTQTITDAQDVAYTGKRVYIICENHWFEFRQYESLLRFVNVDWNMQIQEPVAAQTLAEVADFASLPAAAGNETKSCLVRNQGWFYTSDGSNWHKGFYNAASIALSDNTRDIIPNCFPAPMDNIGPDYNGDPHGYEFKVRLPGFKNVKCRVDANAVSTAQAPTDLPLVLSFKRELWPVQETFWPAGVPYVLTFYMGYASSDEFDPDLVDNYEYSLWWDGPKGLHSLWWEKWALVLSGSQEIEAMVNLSIIDIAALDLHQPVYIQGMKCWIKEIALELPLSKATKVTFLKTR